MAVGAARCNAVLFYLAWRASRVCCVGPGAAGCYSAPQLVRRASARYSKSKLSRRDAADALRGDAAMRERAFDCSMGSLDGCKLAAGKTLATLDKASRAWALQHSNRCGEVVPAVALIRARASCATGCETLALGRLAA